MGRAKPLLGAEISASAQPTPLRPYTLRVVRDHDGGLWTLEDNTGQLYLAVLSRENTEVRRGLMQDAHAIGRPYRWYTRSKRRHVAS